MRNLIVCTVHLIYIARMAEGRSTLKILTGKPTGKRPLGRPSRKWEDNIITYIKDIRAIGLIQPRSGIIGKPL